ncbi:hypothetical protein ACLEPN_30565 [Myxococcus sp. 1LA]
MKRDPITLGRDRVDALEAQLDGLTKLTLADPVLWQSEVATKRAELARERELLRLARIRALNSRLERIRRPRWQVAPAQLGLFDARPELPPARVGGTPIGPGRSLTREGLGLHLPEWPDEAPGTVPPALAYVVMCEERRRDLADPTWGTGPDELVAGDSQAPSQAFAAPPPAHVQACEDYRRHQAEPEAWADPADVELVAEGTVSEPEAWADPADVELVAEPSNVVELPRAVGRPPGPVLTLLLGLAELRTAGGRQ